MKKTLLTLLMATAIPTMIAMSYATDKATDKTPHKPADTKASVPMTQSLLQNVIMPDIDDAQKAIAALKKAITDNGNGQRSAGVDKAFADVVYTWKAVQAAYVAGDLDGDMIDTPRLMDTFHEGNEHLDKQIARALKSGDEPRVALFKNTFKSINALAILLYEDKALTDSERQYANYILDALNGHLTDIKTAYEKQTDAFNQSPDESMSYVLNALIDSSYKLKEWRIGEAAGLTKKYKGKPDNRRQEYARSANSLTAAAAIIGVHSDMMDKRDYDNLGSKAIAQGAEKEVTAIRRLIAKAKEQLDTLRAEKVSDFADPRIKTLYETLGQLNDAYYQSLVKALPVQAKILDADGD